VTVSAPSLGRNLPPRVNGGHSVAGLVESAADFHPSENAALLRDAAADARFAGWRRGPVAELGERVEGGSVAKRGFRGSPAIGRCGRALQERVRRGAG